MKRVLSLALALILFFGVLPLQTNAVQGGKLVALTFDDGPSSTYTPKLLDGLKARNAKATFFVLGQNASNNLGVLQRAYAEGHELASHSWNHPDLTTLSNSEIIWQMNATANVLDKVCGEGTSYLVRPPYGSANSRVRSLLNAPPVFWTVDPEDWRYRNAYTVRNHIVRNAFDGAIILVHDIHGTSVEGALMAVDELQSQGYEFVTVSELHRRRGVTMVNGEWVDSCTPTGTDLGPVAKPEITYTANRTNMTVAITASAGAKIYYTTDGTLPTNSSAIYTGPFQVNYGSVIRAYAAYKMNGSRSELASLTLANAGPARSPRLKAVDGKIEMTAPNADANIYYTVDGSKATANSTVYNGPVELPKDTYIHAVCSGGYYTTSPETVVYHSGRGILFADVAPGVWYFDPIDRLASAGLMSGMGNNIYEPKTKLTRGMLVTMLYAYSGEDLGNGWAQTSPFVDVPKDAWYADAVEWAYRNSVTAGYEPNRFNPNGKLTREQLSVMIDRFLEYRGKTLPRGDSPADRFADSDKIHRWAVSSVEALAGAGLLAGDGINVNPRDNATRAEVAAIICQMIDYETGTH